MVQKPSGRAAETYGIKTRDRFAFYHYTNAVRIDEELALYAFMEWIGEIVDSKNTHLAIDGKGLRGATEKERCGKMLLNVVETVRGLILAQLPVDAKTNEIAVIPELLKLLDIKGSTVTIDAIGTQTAIMEQIHEQGGHFVMAVKKASQRLMGDPYVHG